MKNIYDDNQIMSPDIMDKIAREYSSQKITKQNQLDEKIICKLQSNLALLEYINSYQKNTSVNLQKCLIKTYAIVKDTIKNLVLNPNLAENKSKNINNYVNMFNHNTKSNNFISTNQAKQIILQNSLEIITELANNYKNILSDNEYKAIRVCVESILGSNTL